MFDPFWARVNEAGITVVAHAGDSGYSSHGYVQDGFGSSFEGFSGPNVKLFHIERAIHDFLSTLVFSSRRFPNLRIASVENGQVPARPLQEARLHRRSTSAGFAAIPSPLPRHVWINPFWEDDVRQVVALMGADRDFRLRLAASSMPQPLDRPSSRRSTTAPARRSSATTPSR
jgi:hypothetical protein